MPVARADERAAGAFRVTFVVVVLPGAIENVAVPIVIVRERFFPPFTLDVVFAERVSCPEQFSLPSQSSFTTGNDDLSSNRPPEGSYFFLQRTFGRYRLPGGAIQTLAKLRACARRS